MKTSRVTPPSILAQFNWAGLMASRSGSNLGLGGRSRAKLEVGRRVAHQAHSPWEPIKNPGCGLVDNSLVHETQVRKTVTQIGRASCRERGAYSVGAVACEEIMGEGMT